MSGIDTEKESGRLQTTILLNLATVTDRKMSSYQLK